MCEQHRIEEMDNLFQQFWPIPKRNYFIGGYTNRYDSKLPQLLLARLAPTKQWIYITTFRRSITTAKWLKFQNQSFGRIRNFSDHYLVFMAQKLLEKSGGHPFISSVCD